MGKNKKLKVPTKEKQLSLGDQIETSKIAKPTSRVKRRGREENTNSFIDAKLSKKILQHARHQQLEEEGSDREDVDMEKTVQLGDGSDESDMEEEEEDDFKDMENAPEVEINEDDELALELFMNKNPAPRRTLADLIMEKITEKGTEIQTHFTDDGAVNTLPDIDPRVKKLYAGVRDVLSKYRSGKLPKAFKMIPRMRNWEELLYLTEPDKWSAAAMYQATRIFASNLSEKMAQRFYNLVLYPRIRDDIAEYKRLNFHLYQALRKALFKPAAFMKGIILPLCESGTCTLREAIVVGSLIAKSSIPILHSASAILLIAEMDYSGANSIFLRIFFDKKYALPYRVVDAAVGHFIRFEHDRRELPVLWHQSLLTFVQRYKQDISSEQRDALLKLLKSQSHYMITPEIRRELQNAKCRDLEDATPVNMDCQE